MPRTTIVISSLNHRRIALAVVCVVFSAFLAAEAGVPDDATPMTRDSCTCLQAAPVPRSHAIYAELLGSGAFYSLNYERRVWKLAAIRAGGGFMIAPDDNEYANVILLAMLRSSEYGSAIEAGAGVVGMREKNIDGNAYWGTAGALAIGYHYQQDDGTIIRATFTPLYYKRISLVDLTTKHWRVMVGLSFGYAF